MVRSLDIEKKIDDVIALLIERSERRVIAWTAHTPGFFRHTWGMHALEVDERYNFRLIDLEYDTSILLRRDVSEELVIQARRIAMGVDAILDEFLKGVPSGN